MGDIKSTTGTLLVFPTLICWLIVCTPPRLVASHIPPPIAITVAMQEFTWMLASAALFWPAYTRVPKLPTVIVSVNGLPAPEFGAEVCVLAGPHQWLKFVSDVASKSQAEQAARSAANVPVVILLRICA
jgi:hypothetical protein